ncbi:RNA polymerase sigma factor [Paenibacillus oceani]|uniref:RNA polymerase sigma factor n=1 Tax=Paenibacillus oceani TaxID=2772510 RepID=A0A927CGZ4_9BACL|nr:RNA polymerase sigma factor [Paenibacillus oceani]MBD2865766.1 RNA polymerase sigma factor [Paenibacillus oceani]
MWTSLIQTDQSSKEQQDELLMDVYKQMFIVTYSIMRNKSEAMDAVQESWVKILRKLDTLRDRDKLMQWAKVIATNTAYNMIKRKVAVSLCSPEEDGMVLASSEGVEDRVLRNIIFEEIAKLEEKTRQILTYKFYYDLKDKEIAERMDLPLGTVKARIHRGKEQLRAMLNDPMLKPD